jgi:HEAT repeat protein
MESENHVYIRLEAAAGLARHSMAVGWSFIEGELADPVPENRLETVITLGEIEGGESVKLLIGVLQGADDPEIRAGAAWALGKLGEKKALDALVKSFNDLDNEVRIEAARALLKLAKRYSSEVIQTFQPANDEERAGIAWALSKSGKYRVQDALDMLSDENARLWVAFMIGSQDPSRTVSEIDALKKRDPELYFAITVLWKLISSWTYNVQEY